MSKINRIVIFFRFLKKNIFFHNKYKKFIQEIDFFCINNALKLIFQKNTNNAEDTQKTSQIFKLKILKFTNFS